jgi:lipopolysaccharide export system permease protein
MFKILDRYILREVVPPFLIGLLLVTFVLLMNQVLLLAELFIDKGVPAAEAVRILALLIPSILAFSSRSGSVPAGSSGPCSFLGSADFS